MGDNRARTLDRQRCVGTVVVVGRQLNTYIRQAERIGTVEVIGRQLSTYIRQADRSWDCCSHWETIEHVHQTGRQVLGQL